MKRNPDQQRLMLQLRQDVAKLTEPDLQMLHELEALDPPDPCLKPPEGWRCTRDAEHCAAVQDEAPDTVRSQRAPLLELKRPPSASLKQLLKDLMDQVESGKVIGVTFLCNLGNSTSVWYAGTQVLGDQILAFEDYKFRQLVDRNIASDPTFKDQ